MSNGLAPSATGAPCSARRNQPPASSVADPTPNRNAARNMGSGALEVRRPLLQSRHLRLDHVLAAPGLVEQFLVDRPLLLVGTVVVEDAFRVAQRQGRKP